MGKDISKAKTKKANDASVIAAKQNITKTYTVFGDWDATVTLSGKAWADGQKLSDFDDKADFYIDLVSDQLGADTLSLSRRQVVDCVDAIAGDSEEKQAERVDYIWSEHVRLAPSVNVAAAANSVDTNIEMLADKLAPALGANLDKGWESAKAVRYISAELANILQMVMAPEELSMVPSAGSRKPPKGAHNPNMRYDVAYRGRVKGIDRGPPSWIGDLYDKMPDTNGLKLGQSVLKAMQEVDPENLGVQAVKKKSVERGRLLNSLHTQRRNGVKNMTDAFKLIQRMAFINLFEKVKCEFSTDESGRVAVQNLAPIKVISYRIDNKGEKMVSDIGYYSVSAVLSWHIEHLPYNTASNLVVDAKKPRDTMIHPIEKGEEAIQVFKREAKWFDPASSRAIGKRSEFERALLKVQTTGDDAGLPADQELFNSALWMARLLAPHLPILEAINATMQEKDKDKRSALIEQNAKMLAALMNGSKAA